MKFRQQFDNRKQVHYVSRNVFQKGVKEILAAMDKKRWALLSKDRRIPDLLQDPNEIGFYI